MCRPRKNRSSDAAAKGIEEGDILLSVNGTNVTTMDALNGAVYNLDVGDTVEVVGPDCKPFSMVVPEMRDAEGFNIIWRYFAWANQTLSIFTLWAVTVYLVRERRKPAFLVTFFPALFMTAVCTTYICIAPEGFGIPVSATGVVAILSVIGATLWFCLWYRKAGRRPLQP